MKSQKQIISITQEAKEAILNLMQHNKDCLGIRLKVKPGGCSGYKYVIEYASNKLPFEIEMLLDDTDDLRDESKELQTELGARNNTSKKILFIDPKAVMYIINTTMDYKKDAFSEGFVFLNPNESEKCGCGKSFAV